jgi:hypothetical protein
VLARQVPAKQRPAVLEQIIQDCAHLPRSHTLDALERLPPLIFDVGGEELIRSVSQAIRDVSHWWP